MSKHLRKAIMTRNRLLNKHWKDNSAGNPFAYKIQRIFCVKLLRKSKNFYNNLNVKRMTDNRKFWQTIKPNCTDQTQRRENNPCRRRQGYNKRKRFS